MKGTLLVSLVAAVIPASAKGPFLQQTNATSWIFGNDIWNLTQGPTYAENLQYQGSDAVKSAQGHYTGYGAALFFTVDDGLLTLY